MERKTTHAMKFPDAILSYSLTFTYCSNLAITGGGKLKIRLIPPSFFPLGKRTINSTIWLATGPLYKGVPHPKSIE
jgi:hypothetical protein